MTSRRLLVALWVATITFAVVLFIAHPAGADYSDHGDPATSLPTASTHPLTYSPGLARTGDDIVPWLSAGRSSCSAG